MSEGPIKRERDAWKPPKVSSTDTERVCYQKLGHKAYCGRQAKVAFDDWSKVTCSDCLAAKRADDEAAARALP